MSIKRTLRKSVRQVARKSSFLTRVEIGLMEREYRLSARMRRSSKAERRFVIYSRGRSGSTLLVQLLNAHSSVQCDDEILNLPVALRDPATYVRDRAHLAHKPVYGFKLLSYQLPKLQNIEDQSAFLDDMQRDGFAIIYLYRRDLLRHAISNIMARQRGEFHRRAEGGKAAPGDGKVVIDESDLGRWLKNTRSAEEMEHRVMHGRDACWVCYEDDLESDDARQAAMKRIFEDLSVAPEPVNTNLAKLTSAKLSSFIQNYDDLKNAFSDSEFSQYFD